PKSLSIGLPSAFRLLVRLLSTDQGPDRIFTNKSRGTQLGRPLFRHELLDAPVLDFGHVDGAAAVHCQIVREVQLAWNLSVRPQYAQDLAIQVELDNAIVQAVAHIQRVVA